MRLSWLFVALVACTGGPTTVLPKDSDSDTPVPTDDSDVPETGTDNDGDGYTVEKGDCDDDNIWVNPGWPEDPSDDLDNDCDGRIDEVFSGLVVSDIDTQQIGDTWLRTIDNVGDQQALATLSNIYPRFIDTDHDLDGWVMLDPYLLGIYTLNRAATRTSSVASLAGFSWPSGDPDWIWGLAAHPDGYYLVGAFKYLLKVTPSGTMTVAATWDADLSGNGPHDLALLEVRVDRTTGQTHLFGAAGGYATWTERGGIKWKRKDDLVNGGRQAFGPSVYCDGDGVYVWASNAAGRTGVFKWSGSADNFVLHHGWNTQMSVDGLTCEGDSGDFYLLTKAGWAQQVWRMLGSDGSVTGPLYDTGQVYEHRRFYAAGIRYDQD